MSSAILASTGTFDADPGTFLPRSFGLIFGLTGESGVPVIADLTEGDTLSNLPVALSSPADLKYSLSSFTFSAAVSVRSSNFSSATSLRSDS